MEASDNAEITPTWQSFFDLRDQIDVPDDFMSERGDGPPQDRVLFA
jgi:hypothetical protein